MARPPLRIYNTVIWSALADEVSLLNCRGSIAGEGYGEVEIAWEWRQFIFPAGIISSHSLNKRGFSDSMSIIYLRAGDTSRY